MKHPTIEDRTIVIGPTGSGKTYAGLYLLSEQPIDEMPFIVVDYKRDKTIAQIPYAEYVPIGYIPQHPGIYVVQPMLKRDDSAMEEYLNAIWETECIGLFIDEGFMLARSGALELIFIQGRSKQIPVIILTQRPVDISRYAFSEAQFRMLFPNDDKREQKTVSEFMPLFREKNSNDHLIPEFHSYYYEVKKRRLEKLSPVPKLSKIMQTFERKLKPPETSEQIEEILSIPQKIKYTPL